MDTLAQLPPALAKFQATVDTLVATRDELKSMSEHCAELGLTNELEHHMHKILGALVNVEKVQSMVRAAGGKISAIKRGLPDDFGKALPEYLSDATLCSLSGGTAILSSVDYSARCFIQRAKGDTVTSPAIVGVDWALLGVILKTLAGN
jgi:hypothetical protein